MPNAKDVGETVLRRILLLGNTGTGKTAQFATLEGKKFLYAFDANSLPTLRGLDIEYEEFLPSTIPLDVRSLDKVEGSSNKERKGDRHMASIKSEVYLDWEKDFTDRMQKGFFRDYRWLGFDSATTFLDLIMDRLLSINGRSGQFPQQDDWGPQMVTFTNVMRTASGMGINLFLTGHLKTDKDEFTQRIVQLPLFTGQLREKIPLLFSDIFKTSSVTVQGAQPKVAYQLETVPNQRETPIRTAMRGLKPVEDVTIDWTKPLEGVQGLGKLLKERS